jgi:hypothetical protein
MFFSPWDSLCASFWIYAACISVWKRTKRLRHPLRISPQKTCMILGRKMQLKNRPYGFLVPAALLSLAFHSHAQISGRAYVHCTYKLCRSPGTCIVCFLYLCCVHSVKIMFNKTKNNICWCYTANNTFMGVRSLPTLPANWIYVYARRAQKSFTPLLLQAEHVRALAFSSTC